MQLLFFILCVFSWNVLIGLTNRDTQQLTIICVAVDALAVSNSPPPLVLSQAKAGDRYFFVVDESTTYAITTNNQARSIFATLSKPMPPGLVLSVFLRAPTGASSWGMVPLNTSLSRLVSGISNLAERNLSITYLLKAPTTLPPVVGTNELTYYIGP